MKTIRVVAAVICEDDKIFATAKGYGELLMDVEWLPADISLIEEIGRVKF